MSTRQTGNRHENSVCRQIRALGYATFCARGSRGSADIVAFGKQYAFSLILESPIAGHDFIGVPPIPLVVQVGTHNKAIEKTLIELEASERPIGSLCIVARRKLNKSRRIVWTFHTRAGTFHSLAQAIEQREAA